MSVSQRAKSGFSRQTDLFSFLIAQGVGSLVRLFFSLYSDAESNRIRVNGGLSLWVRAAVGLACRPA